MSTTIYNSSSPYFNTPQSSWALDLWQGITIPQYDTDLVLNLPTLYQNKPHLLAYDLYGDSRLWWVFAVRNPDVIVDPIYDFVAGIEIYITDKDTLLGIINAQ